MSDNSWALLVPQWMHQAECQSYPDAPWSGTLDDPTGRIRAGLGRVCARCPVLAECDEYASTRTVATGFWAGRHRGEPDPTPKPVDPSQGRAGGGS